MPQIFETTHIKSMELKNRLVRLATQEGMANDKSFSTPVLIKLHEKTHPGRHRIDHHMFFLCRPRR